MYQYCCKIFRKKELFIREIDVIYYIIIQLYIIVVLYFLIKCNYLTVEAAARHQCLKHTVAMFSL